MPGISTFEGTMDKVILDRYDIFNKESKENFKNKYGSIIFDNYKFVAQSSTVSESYVVQRAKLLIHDKFKSRGNYLFNEISARKGKESGAPVVDLYDPNKRFGIELHWRTKTINHKEMLKRMKIYNERFGKVILIFLQWGEGKGWTRFNGFNFLHDHVMQRYDKEGIKYYFFNVDKPVFDWLI